MKRLVPVLALALLFVLAPVPPSALAAQSTPVITGRQRLVDGLRHETFRVRLDDGDIARGNVVSVAKSARLRVEPVHAGGRTIRGVKTTPKMASAELRRGGLALMNGGFWLPLAGSKPHGVAATDRVVFTGPKTQWGRPGHRGTLGIRSDGTTIFTRLAGGLRLVRPDGTHAAIDDLNYVPLAVGAARDSGELLAYTPSWATAVKAPSGSIVVWLSKVTLPVIGTAMATVSKVAKTAGTVDIPKGGALLVGYGEARAHLDGLAPGDKVGVDVNVQPLDVPADAWVESADALPGGPLIVRNGKMTKPNDWVNEGFSHQRHNGPRHPRTAVGVTGSGEVLLVTVDGRQSHSVGMTMWELAELLLDLGARQGLSLDGGGSTTMTVLGRTRNKISDPRPRPVANGLVARYIPDLTVRDPSETACPAARVPAVEFTDVGGSTHRSTIACLAWYDITAGRTRSAYGPGQPVTRAQMASFLARMIDYIAANPGGETRGRPLTSAGVQRFNDLPAGSPHTAAVSRLAAAGIVGGGPGDLPLTSYGPTRNISRAQMASLLDRTIAYVRAKPLAGGGNVFADDAGNAHEAAINRLAEAGVVQGRTPGLYAPDAPVERAAMASFLQRTIEVFAAAGMTRPPE